MAEVLITLLPTRARIDSFYDHDTQAREVTCECGWTWTIFGTGRQLMDDAVRTHEFEHASGDHSAYFIFVLPRG